MYTRLVRSLVLCGLGVVLTTSAIAESYVTEAGVQIDRCASAWFISRFVDPEAQFAFFPSGNPPPKGVTYAFYGADYSRVGAGCTYTALLKAHELEGEPALRKIDTIANDTMAWRQGPQSLALAMREGVDQIRESLGSDQATYDQVFPIFDLIYLKSGGRSSVMHTDIQALVDGVESRLLSQWLARLPDIVRDKALADWEEALNKAGLSLEVWNLHVSSNGIQLPELDQLTDWAVSEGERLPIDVRCQIALCIKIADSMK